MDAPHQTRDVLAESPGGAALGWVFWDGQLNPVDGMTQSWFSNATPMFFVHLTRVMIDFVSIWHDQLQLNGAGISVATSNQMGCQFDTAEAGRWC
jgi:hypothetical protein